MPMPDIVKELIDPTFKPEWRKVADFKPGDRVSWWTQHVEVLAVKRDGGEIVITVRDYDGSEVPFRYRDNQELSFVGRKEG